MNNKSRENGIKEWWLGSGRGWFLLLLLSAACLLFDIPQAAVRIWNRELRGQERTSQTAPSSANSDQSDPQPFDRDFLVASYENAVKEIHARLEHESLLFSLKFALIGSILALLFKSSDEKEVVEEKPKDAATAKPQNKLDLMVSPRSACFVWAAVITSGIIDTRIQFHQDIIAALGKWIKATVEPRMIGGIGWESYLSQNDGIVMSYVYPLLRLNTSLLTFVLFAAVAYVALQFARTGDASSDPLRQKIRRYCWGGSAGACFVFFLVSIHFHYERLHFGPAAAMLWSYYASWTLAGFCAAWRLWGAPLRDQGDRHSSSQP